MEITQELVKTVGKLLDVSSRKNIIFDDHSYALEDKTYIPGNYISIPTQFLFLDSFTKIRRSNDIEVDIVTVNENINQKSYPNILEEKFHNAIQESQIINRDGDYENDWQSNVIKFTWSNKQIMIYDRSVSILINYQQAKIIYDNGISHTIKRKIFLEKSANKFRNLLILFDWEIELIKWLHYNLVSLLPISLLVAYTEILCQLKAKIPWVVLEMTESAFSPSTDLSASLNQGMNNGIMHKQIKDNFNTISSLIHNVVVNSTITNPKSSINSHMSKPQLAKNKTIVLIVPPLPFEDISKSTNSLGVRFNRWINDFMIQDCSWAVEILSVEGPGNEFSSGNGLKFEEEQQREGGLEMEISPLLYVRSVFAALRTKIMKLKSQNPTSTLIVWGWSVASLMACYASLQTSVDAVVCLGFPFVDLKEKRLTSLGNEMGGQLENNLVLLQKLTCPIVYVIGAISRINSIKFVEQLRYRQKSAPSALIVVGHVNDELCLLEDCLWITDSNDETVEVHLNQEVADALMFDSIHNALSQLITSHRTQRAPTLTTLTTSIALSATASLNNLKSHKRTSQSTKIKSKVPKLSKSSKLTPDNRAFTTATSGSLQTPQYSSFPIMSAQVSPGKPLLKKLFTD